MNQRAASAFPRPAGLVLDPDFEQRSIDAVRRMLDDDPDCRAADYSVRWVAHPEGPMPLLVIAFHLPQTADQPALAIALVTVRKETLLETNAERKLLTGDRLRTHVLRSVDHYLTRHGVRLSLPQPGGLS